MKKITLVLILLAVSFGYAQELVTNGDFQTGVGSPWYNGALNVVDLGGGNWVNQAEILAAGNAWDVNISQDVVLEDGKTYELSYDAWTDAVTASRTIIAGLGQNGPGWANLAENPTLTATQQTFTHQFTINYGDGVDDRVIFDMGAETGFVFIDNVSIIEIVDLCNDGILNNGEIDIDCGGPNCDACPNGLNLALNGTASASSELNPASNAIDGDSGTRWESVHGETADITIDLGMSYDIGQIVLNWEGAFADEYTIDISSDNINWTTIYSTTTGDGVIDDLAVTGTGQYVRMNGIHRFLNAWGYSLYEFEIYEALDATTIATLSDLTVDGVTVTGFGANTFNYNVELPQGTTMVPTVVATTSQASPASAVVTDASGIPGTTTVLVTAQNGVDTNTYTINFAEIFTPVQATFDLTFESGTAGSDASNWDTFENGANPPFEIVSNPDASGVNTSSRVAKFTSLAGESEWAGCANQHGTIWEWELDASSTTLTIDVYKSVISDVMVKIVNTTNGTIYAVQQPNTVINAWETLTYDISGSVSSGENHDNDTIVIHPDIMNPRTTDNTSYFDNISWDGFKLAEAPTVLNVANYDTTQFKVYPNPAQNVWNLKSSNGLVNSVQVYDVLGKQIMALQPHATEVSIAASELKPGIYLAKVVSNNGSKIIRLVKN
ncbi:discoidin domain-containing protein [Winogradskyella psychrotolerans]|uniref:discoidin domain-containing protein n=1 Tax=Winogradskyella psychrotolerans TaxID=1344585 RepID=UPI001C07DEBB|nr:discoidin domain-containing protein [Winogradskyella psychrotolerans]MBU2929129.1 discoidin domain-containing protein [Winogradskyella psychrotolerans]